MGAKESFKLLMLIAGMVLFLHSGSIHAAFELNLGKWLFYILITIT